MSMNQDNQTPGQDGGFGGGGEEFVFTEEKKPVNRNVVVLLLIAVVGGGLIYLMYARNKSGAGGDSESTKAKAEQVAKFMEKGEQDLKDLGAKLDQMENQVDKVTRDPIQVPTGSLNKNPFRVDKDEELPPPPPGGGVTIPDPPSDDPEPVLRKVEISTIIFAGKDSTCILNNKLCSIRDQVTLGGITFTVKDIGRDYVLLTNKARDFKVTVKAKGLESR